MAPLLPPECRLFSHDAADMAFAGFGSWNGHAISILKPVRRNVPRAIVLLGPREKRHLRDL
ncbi:MAG TPA: hypothetical protein VG759_03285, partial [Candidatus Angelobacter sp.]|nr:hypothetical protein [Candidatus Angelobacter sp.]